MEDIFGPVQQGFRDIIAGANARKEREYRQAEIENRKAEIANKKSEITAKQADEIRKQTAQKNLTDYVTSGNSSLIADPQLAGLLNDAGQSITPALKPKVDVDTLAKFKLKIVQDALGNVENLGDKNIDPQSITDQQNVAWKIATGVDLKEQALKATQRQFNDAWRKVPEDKREWAMNQFKDYIDKSVKPFYKAQGYTDDELDEKFKDGASLNKYFITYANNDGDPLKAVVETEKKNLQGLDEDQKQLYISLNRYGTMSTQELAAQDPTHMTQFEKDIWMKSRTARFAADMAEKIGVPHVGNLFDTIQSDYFYTPASKDFETRMQTRSQERKAAKGIKGVTGGGNVFRGEKINDLTQIPTNSSDASSTPEIQSRMQNKGMFVR